MSQAAQEIRDLLGARPGSVNRFMRRWGRDLVDYATALVPDRAAPFAALAEDLLVDAIAQCRALPRDADDASVQRYVIESALRTVRARYRELLENRATPEKATNSYTVEEILARTSMTSDEISRGISEGRMRAVRADNTMRVKGEDVPGLGERRNMFAYCISGAERELLCLHYRFNLQADEIARFSASSPAHIESQIRLASLRLGEAIAGKRNKVGPHTEDGEFRRYIEGRMRDDETSRFEARVVKDKIAQQRLDELRGERQGIKDVFEAEPYDLSRIAVNVRERNPHVPAAVPPTAALWLQVAGIVAVLLLLHRVGAFIAPPDVRLDAHEGAVHVDDNRPPSALSHGRFVIGQRLSTGAGGQASLVLDTSNRVRIAEHSDLSLLDPRPEARQVLRLERGELWGRFVSSSHAWAVEFPVGQDTMLAHGATSAEFDLVLTPGPDRVPDNMLEEAARALAAAFELREGKAVALRRVTAVAGVQFRVPGAAEGEFAAIEAGDELLDAGRGAPANADDLVQAALLALRGTLALRRNGNALALEAVAGVSPAAVLRVYRGSVMVQAMHGSEQLNRGQWAAFYPSLPMLVGLRGPEDYRLLRMDAAERFKDQFHWLNTENFPLRAENSLLAIERRLSALAGGLEAQRSDEVARDARAEIDRFERLLIEAIAAARTRMAEGKGNPRAEGELGLSDEELVRGETELLGAVAHWRKTAATGAYSTLGSAAKTLHARITKDRDDMAARDADLGRAAALKQRLGELDTSLAAQDEAIAKLKVGELYDGDGSKRAALDVEIRTQLDAARAGRDATQRLELIRLKLNELDAQADTERRKLAPLREAVAAAEKALGDVDAALSANAYTAAKLAVAETAVTEAEAALGRANAQVKERETALAEADRALNDAASAATEAEKPLAEATLRRDQAADELAAAVAARSAAAKARDDAAQKVKDAEAALAALPQNDPARAKAEADLENARKALLAADATLNTARDQADTAKAAHDAADKLLRDAEAALDTARKAKAGAAEARAAASVRLDQGRKDATAAGTVVEAARQAVKAQQDAKVAREALDKQRLEAATKLATAQSSLKTVQDAVAAIDAEAQPRREKMAAENKLVEAGEAAAAEAKKLAARRDQFQAVLDDIALREKERKTTQDERDRVAGSQLITGHEALVTEFRQLSARVALLEYVRARALAEDQSYSHAQQAARDRYREAASRADAEASAFLLELLRPYRDFALADNAADAETIRRKLALALWRLYYDTGTEAAPDAAAQACYYVAVRAGAGEDALRALDDRWALALAQMLDRPRYEKAGKLKAADLVAATRE